MKDEGSGGWKGEGIKGEGSRGKGGRVGGSRGWEVIGGVGYFWRGGVGLCSCASMRLFGVVWLFLGGLSLERPAGLGDLFLGCLDLCAVLSLSVGVFERF